MKPLVRRVQTHTQKGFVWRFVSRSFQRSFQHHSCVCHACVATTVGASKSTVNVLLGGVLLCWRISKEQRRPSSRQVRLVRPFSWWLLALPTVLLLLHSSELLCQACVLCLCVMLIIVVVTPGRETDAVGNQLVWAVIPVGVTAGQVRHVYAPVESVSGLLSIRKRTGGVHSKYTLCCVHT